MNRKTGARIALLFLVLLLLVGSVTNRNDPEPKPTTTTTTVPAYPDHVKAALSDAVHRFGVPMDAISVVTVEEVIWRSSALGCPQPDMHYLQVLVDGYLIVLDVDGKEVRYHGQVGRDPFVCTQLILLLA